MKTLLAYASVVGVVLALVGPGQAIAGSPQQHQHAQQALAQQSDQTKMGHMKMEEMAARNRANTERLTALMAQVRSATGDAKVDAMGDVIAILLDERTAMQEHCAAMHGMMKQ